MYPRYQLAIKWFLLLTCAACGSDSTGPSGETYQGEYAISGGAQAPAEPVRFRVVSQTADRVILDWIDGDVRGELPVRDTALINGSSYRLDWRQRATNSPLYIVQLIGGSCTGQTMYGFGNSPAWGSCQLGR